MPKSGSKVHTCARQNDIPNDRLERVQPSIERRALALSSLDYQFPATTEVHLIDDSTIIKMLGNSGWETKTHGADYPRQWHQVSLGIDAATLEIPAIEGSRNAIGTAPMLPCLLNQIPEGWLWRSGQTDASPAAHHVCASPMTQLMSLLPAAKRKRLTVKSPRAAAVP